MNEVAGRKRPRCGARNRGPFPFDSGARACPPSGNIERKQLIVSSRLGFGLLVISSRRNQIRSDLHLPSGGGDDRAQRRHLSRCAVGAVVVERGMCWPALSLWPIRPGTQRRAGRPSALNSEASINRVGRHSWGMREGPLPRVSNATMQRTSRSTLSG